MAFKPGESGNPGGGVREKRFLSALERAIAQEDGKKLRSAAEKLLDAAAAGEPWAINQLADRLDGKPGQSIEMNVRRIAKELDDDELNRIAAGSRDRTAQAAGGAPESRELH